MHNSYDIHNKLIQFDSYRIPHMNAPWKGDRYAIVFFNKDLNYVDSPDVCGRSNRIRQTKPSDEIILLDYADASDERKKLMNIINSTHFPEDRTSGLRVSTKYGKTRGSFIAFGVTKTRKNRKERASKGIYTRKEMNINNTRHAELYNALSTYINTMYPNLFGIDDKCMYHACIIAKNSQCIWHVDAGNIGPCVITALGDFEGGELLIKSV